MSEPGRLSSTTLYSSSTILRVPTENVKRLGAITSAEASQWCALGTLLVPYGGFLAANLQPGETVLVSGATGNFGSAAVSVALAMGAACVVAPGRNDRILADLVRRFGDRVKPVKLTGNESDDCESMKRAAPGRSTACSTSCRPRSARPSCARRS